MNPRVLELIKNPKNIQLEDLSLLKEEIHTFPYIQNIRALHLYGVHLYEKENYQKELSTTAAYTTDKKILYQLINGKIRQAPKPEPVVEKQSSESVEKAVQYAYKSKDFPLKRESEVSSEKQAEENNKACILPVSQEIKPIYVNGERNRILFEGEENFLDEEISETIDIESTLESGILVTHKPEAVTEPVQGEKEETQAEIEENAGEDFSPETLINEDEISSEPEEAKVEEEENLSFQETESILPEINIEENTNEEPIESETAIESEDISVSEAGQQQDESDAEISFHGTDTFLPDVKIQTNSEEVTETAEISQSNVNKHEEEMRRLIEEVEKKMKETKSVSPQEKEEAEPVLDHEISFAETQSFHFWSTSEEAPVAEEVKAEPVKEEVTEVQKSEEKEGPKEEITEDVPEVQPAWKPMSVESNLPDSLISKSAEAPVPAVEPSAKEERAEGAEEEIKTEHKESEEVAEAFHEEILPAAEEISEETDEQIETTGDHAVNPDGIALKEEAPVMNVSFFGSDISSLRVEEKQKENKEEPVEERTVQEEVIMKDKAQSPVDSNVPGFINTWQSWLKIDRKEDVEKEKAVIKEKAIENFIENNPRISQLKEESTYVVKEKNDDISHLMTETLANLYFEQKLYTKAIKAFEILIKKNPGKKNYFESKIQEIKDFRSKN